MDVGSVIKNLKDNFYKRFDRNEEVRFLDSSSINHAICLEIAEATFKNELISYEDLCHIIPRKIGARSTILNTLNLGVSKGFFIKKNSIEDKRKKTYRLSEKFQESIKEWITELKNVTSLIE